METCMLLCFHVQIYIKTFLFPCNLSINFIVLTFDPTGKGSIRWSEFAGTDQSQKLGLGQFSGKGSEQEKYEILP